MKWGFEFKRTAGFHKHLMSNKYSVSRVWSVLFHLQVWRWRWLPLSGILYIMGIIERRHQNLRGHYGDCLGDVSLQGESNFLKFYSL